MTRQDFSQNWVPYRDPLMDRFPSLTDGDLEDADGSTAALAKRIAEGEGTTPAEAQQTLHEFLDGPLPADAYAEPVNDNAAVMQSERYIPEGEDALTDDRRFGDDDKIENPIGRDRSS
ncbi:hypothetical protein JQC91_12265 [Jannaschia sp. Os4]|uniref:hypothetical protein n=1 Tax=Jannaschia sp. Os4 TaxID=2807617 RepID=UPI0019393C0A|nr:hypothetical protein [Jannaschia sp. Os4]MBM2577073.1 hypothetical protein [Jannaschia sp. Os4]